MNLHFCDLGRSSVPRRAAAVIFVSAFCAIAAMAKASDRLETRCGWFTNPTPANMWLNDRDGEWIIGAQSGHQAEGDWDWPKFMPGDWVKTNFEYGYGCACFRVRVDKRTHKVLFIEKAWARPLAACESDPALGREIADDRAKSFEPIGVTGDRP